MNNEPFGPNEFNDFSKLLLIEFIHNPNTKSLIVVTDHWGIKEGTRGFKKISFEGVNKFQRLFGASKELKNTENTYHIKEYEGCHSIEKIKASKMNSKFWRFIVNIDNTFGGFKFECGNVSIDSRIGIGKKVGPEEWIYRDSNTKKVFDFYHPFST